MAATYYNIAIILFYLQRIGNQQCLLGETRTIERRRPNVCCWNGRQYERLISTTPCQCTAADFEWLVLFLCICNIIHTATLCIECIIIKPGVRRPSAGARLVS